MQYLLTEEEYLVHIQNKEKLDDLPSKEALQIFCTWVANNTPVLFWGRKEPKIWGCMLTEDDEWYCDECPSRKICPYEYKGWSK